MLYESSIKEISLPFGGSIGGLSTHGSADLISTSPCAHTHEPAQGRAGCIGGGVEVEVMLCRHLRGKMPTLGRRRAPDFTPHLNYFASIDMMDISS
jgi:hypothetical protein